MAAATHPNPRITRRRLTQLMKALAICTALLLLLFTISACQTWKVTPPSNVQNPARVFLNEHGMHTTVSFPEGEKRYVEFGFGEWHYYGREQHGIGSSLRAVAGGGSGALSRREIIAEQIDNISFARSIGATRSAGIDVPRERMDLLKAKLEQRWLESTERLIRANDNIEVRRDPQSYHLLKNSNAVSADWLREMSADVQGTPIWSNFEIVE